MEMGHECPTHVVEHATIYEVVKLLVLLHFGCLLLDHAARLDLVLFCDGWFLLCLLDGSRTFFPEALKCCSFECLFTLTDLLLCSAEVLKELELLLSGHRESVFCHFWGKRKQSEFVQPFFLIYN